MTLTFHRDVERSNVHISVVAEVYMTRLMSTMQSADMCIIVQKEIPANNNGEEKDQRENSEQESVEAPGEGMEKETIEVYFNISVCSIPDEEGADGEINENEDTPKEVDNEVIQPAADADNGSPALSPEWAKVGFAGFRDQVQEAEVGNDEEDTKAENGDGQLKAENGDGQLKAENGDGHLKAENGDGQLKAENGDGQLKAENGDGHDADSVVSEEGVKDAKEPLGEDKHEQVGNITEVVDIIDDNPENADDAGAHGIVDNADGDLENQGADGDEALDGQNEQDAMQEGDQERGDELMEGNPGVREEVINKEIVHLEDSDDAINNSNSQMDERGERSPTLSRKLLWNMPSSGPAKRLRAPIIVEENHRLPLGMSVRDRGMGEERAILSNHGIWIWRFYVGQVVRLTCFCSSGNTKQASSAFRRSQTARYVWRFTQGCYALPHVVTRS